MDFDTFFVDQVYQNLLSAGDEQGVLPKVSAGVKDGTLRELPNFHVSGEVIN